MNMHDLTFRLRLHCALLLLSFSIHAASARAESPYAAFSDIVTDQPSTAAVAATAESDTSPDKKLDAALKQRQQTRNGYVARSDGARDFFNALAARLKKPVVVSNLYGILMKIPCFLWFSRDGEKSVSKLRYF